MRQLILFFALLSFSVSVAAKGKFDSPDFSLTEQKALETAAKCGIAQTLVVLDIDNTLLVTKQPLGGDAWFNWQASLLGSGSAQSAANDIGALLKLQGTLFSLSGMRAVDAQNPDVVRHLQEAGFPVIALSSRGYDFRDSTLRELKFNAYSFVDSAIGPHAGYAGQYLPYDLNQPAGDGLTSDEVARFKLGTPRAVMFESGVFFGSGQHKGAMLKTLLHKTGYSACGIVFTDDTPSNTEKVWDAFNGGPIDITVIRYGKLDDDVKAFQASDKSEIVTDLNRLMSTLSQIFK